MTNLLHTHTNTQLYKNKRVVFRKEATSFQRSHPAASVLWFSVSLTLPLDVTQTLFPVRFTNNSVTFFDLPTIAIASDPSYP